MPRSPLFLSMLLLIGAFFNAHATILDNRYVPFLPRPIVAVPDKKSYIEIAPFFLTASRGYDKSGDANELGIPELTGVYDQQAVARSFVALGCENPLPSRFQNRSLLWSAQGKLLGQGVELAVQQHLFSNCYAGFYAYFMRVDTTSAFLFNRINDGFVTASDVLLLDRVRRCMNAQAGLTTNDHASQIGFGDLDMFLLWRDQWNYLLKMRSISAQARLGVLVPSGQSRNIYEPTSIPFGGNGFWGVYVSGQGEFELKEDWKGGLLLWISKRFERTKRERIPLYCEPFQFSPFVSNVKVNPGPLFAAQLWASFEHVHKGLGARVILTVRRHWRDSWNILCCPPTCDDAVRSCIEDETSWGSDYITLNVFYDFAKIKVNPTVEPIIFLAWDIPSSMFDTKRTLKTNKVTLGVELSF